MLPSVPIFAVYNFFRQNIWHSIFDQFHFQHIFWDETTVSSDKKGKEQWQLETAETFRGPFEWFSERRIFEAPLSHSHSTGPQKEDTTRTKRRTTSAFACLV